MAKLIKIGKVWYSDLRFGKKRIRRALSTDKRVAEEKLADLVSLRSAEKNHHSLEDMSWILFKRKYLDYSRANKKKHTTYYDELAIRNLENEFPITRLSQITPELLEQLKSKWKINGKQPNQINRLIYALKTAMRRGFEWGYGTKQNWESVKPIKTTQARTAHFSREEIQEMIKQFKGDYLTVIYLGSRAGLRLGEMVSLQSQDVDFDRHRLNITAKDGWEPKDYEARSIPMKTDLETYLKSIIANGNGSILNHQWSVSSLSNMISRLMREYGFKGTAHTLRHTFGSHLVMSGVPLKTIAKWMGHASTETTEKHYTHLSVIHEDEQIKKLEDL